MDIDITKLELGQVFGAFFITFAVISAIVFASIKIYKAFMKLHNAKSEQEKKDYTIESHSKQIAEMDLRHKEDYKNLDTKIDTLTTTLQMFISETKKDNQVILRDKIYDIYQLTLQKGYILEKDNKNYHYALERYLANDGNSYVCDEIEPRMKDFKVFISDEDAEEYFKKNDR
jgi:hypothetical protein